MIAGGTSTAGASDRVYLLNTKTGVLTTLGHLPAATAHAQAFTLGSAVYVGGGVDSSGNVTGAVYRVDLAARRVSRVAGSLAVRDGATVALGNSALVLGGATSAGTIATVRRITVR